jgi:hypothetical protein
MDQAYLVQEYLRHAERYRNDKLPPRYDDTLEGLGRRLSYADFQGQDLRNVNFVRCDLLSANFTECDLRGCDFTHAHLSGASMRGARLEGAVIYPHQIPRTISPLFESRKAERDPVDERLIDPEWCAWWDGVDVLVACWGSVRYSVSWLETLPWGEPELPTRAQWAAERLRLAGQKLRATL